MAGIENVRQVIVVASGKGGVGKTTVAVNLALALARQGYRVGLMDADIYGPSVPTMLGLRGEPIRQGEALVPLSRFGILVMSLGFLLDEDQPVIWRGPLASKAVLDLLRQVAWGSLDFLVVDLPPGTGDPVITIAKSLPAAEVVMVTTPQQVALADVRRAIRMFQRLQCRVTGIVENMAWFSSGHDEERIEIFGSGGGEALSRETGIPLLASVPIDIALREGGDAGVPLVESAPESPASQVFTQLALRLSLESAAAESPHAVH